MKQDEYPCKIIQLYCHECISQIEKYLKKRSIAIEENKKIIKENQPIK